MVDFTNKLKSKNLPAEEVTAINEFVNFINFCFTEKNNFFITSFNKYSLRRIYTFYNTLKSNIICETNNITDNMVPEDIKCIKFVICNLLKKYVECTTIHQIITVDSLHVMLRLFK